MAFEKDHPKVGGRKKGTPNKTTQEMREKLQRVFDMLHEDIDTIIQGLSDSEKARFYLGIAEYILPKLSRATLAAADDGEVVIRVIKGIEKPKEE